MVQTAADADDVNPDVDWLATAQVIEHPAVARPEVASTLHPGSIVGVCE